MTTQSIQGELKAASLGGYAVPLYDVFDQFGVDGVFEALEEVKVPVILGIYSGATIFKMNATGFVAYIRDIADRIEPPVSIMLDHGSTIDQCYKALDCGFTDVMYDGSQLSLEENIENTKLVVERAKKYNASVEAELGHVGSGREYAEYGGQRKGFTNPDLVDQFVTNTGVDFLAVAFGNAHGLYTGEPHIDLNLLKEIRTKIDIPLVMHGGSGLVDEDYRKVVAAGIAKINIFTAIHTVATQKMVDVAKMENPNMFLFCQQIKDAYVEVCQHFFEIFGTHRWVENMRSKS
jgi:fructose-bisphosphate aldolase class II